MKILIFTLHRKKTLYNDSEEIEYPNIGAQFNKCVHQECAKYALVKLPHHPLYDT